MASGTSFSHVGLCVADLERSLRFYCDGLGFVAAERWDIDNTFAASLEAQGDVELVSQFIRRDDLGIELLGWRSPTPSGVPSSSRTQLGLTHLSFYVDDPDATAARLVELGGSVVDGTRCEVGPMLLVFLADPDGTRVELMRRIPTA